MEQQIFTLILSVRKILRKIKRSATISCRDVVAGNALQIGGGIAKVGRRSSRAGDRVMRIFDRHGREYARISDRIFAVPIHGHRGHDVLAGDGIFGELFHTLTSATLVPAGNTPTIKPAFRKPAKFGLAVAAGILFSAVFRNGLTNLVRNGRRLAPNRSILVLALGLAFTFRIGRMTGRPAAIGRARPYQIAAIGGRRLVAHGLAAGIVGLAQ